jgi:hypothetical protein
MRTQALLCNSPRINSNFLTALIRRPVFKFAQISLTSQAVLKRAFAALL